MIDAQPLLNMMPGDAPQDQRLAFLHAAVPRHIARLYNASKVAADTMLKQAQEISDATQKRDVPGLAESWTSYVMDSFQRATLTLDALRKRGDIFLEHEAIGAPPVLIYDYEVIMDGKDLPRPCNYMLLKILPPEGIEIDERQRPYMIIDPRAGHGAGIGGFKPDSQVGVGLRHGNPVYFVAFRPIPEPNQTLADVTHAEAAFLREVQRRHPHSPRPVVMGNCQGGWATAILAARNPDLTGPIVLNGAPMSYWAGRLGQDPMRYTGGMVAGITPVLLLSDLGGGKFDGANLVLNFEMLNPGRTWFRNYYDLFANIDERTEKRFLEFEKWWGGFYLMNEAEIHWIVENLFVGNRLGANEARLETGRPIDLKAIKAPIIVFASHGDTITPPQQALNWIVDTYADETEIEIRGQRIFYMVHEEVGHLGIFVSSSVAKKEHSEMAGTLPTIEALPPGLYEIVIKNAVGEGMNRRFTLDFVNRKMSDILALDDDRNEEQAFAAVARLSENMAEIYDIAIRPFVKQVGSGQMGEVMRRLHPMRVQREIFASSNPLMAPVKAQAEEVRAQRQKAQPDNPFLLAEKLWADYVEYAWNVWRDSRAMAFEASFLMIYANPLAVTYGASRVRSRTRRAVDELRSLPEVQLALACIAKGGLAEAAIRMLVLLADAGGNVRHDRLKRSSEVLTTREPFTSIGAFKREQIIHEQSLVVQFEPEQGLATLPLLLPSEQERHRALNLVRYVIGSLDEMEPKSFMRLSQMYEVLGLGPLQTPPSIAAALQDESEGVKRTESGAPKKPVTTA
ncbi:MAG: DUF3141 domain-containing protein [Pseudomonadota bacterium]